MKQSSEKRSVLLRLIHDGKQPGQVVPEPVHFGLQDLKGEVHPGHPGKGSVLWFDFFVEFKDRRNEPPVFSGPFCHGPPKARFLYLSWKREGTHAAPWAWRIKIPLSGISWTSLQEADASDRCIQADVTNRRPHGVESVKWDVVLRD